MIPRLGRRILLILPFAIVLSSTAFAHFNVVLPAEYGQWQANRRSEVAYRLVWGHGYEHIWMDASAPESLVAHAPSGKTVDLKPALTPTEVFGAEDKKARAFGFVYKPDERGDHIIAMKAALVWDEHEGVFLQDYAKSVLHVQDKIGWDRALGQDLELVAVSRPYALQPGAIVQMQLLSRSKPLAGCMVELEKLQPHAPPPDVIPPEELVTFEAKTDANGIVTFAPTGEEPGGASWYAVTAIHPTGETLERDGNKGLLVERATFWINVVPLGAAPSAAPNPALPAEGESGVGEKPAIERCY